MIQSFDSWRALNEAMAKGKEVFRDPTSGQIQRAVWKVQDSTSFMLKLIHQPDIIDESGKITQLGIDSITGFFNSQAAFIGAIGKLDSTFFSTKLLLYTVLADTERRQKIQFKVVDRAMYLSIPKNVNYVSEVNMAYLEPEKSDAIVAEVKDKVKKEDTEEQPEKVVQKTEDQGKGTIETAKERGNKFLYTMRTNGKLYLMEFGPSGELIADVQKEENPNGVISYENNKVMWITDLDNKTVGTKWMQQSSNPLYTDSEITNPQDKEFLTKIFTDIAFRNQTIDDYDVKYGKTELNAENLKNMLYYQDGTPIFAVPATPVEGQTETGQMSQEQAAQELLKTNI